jgi:hypothetical protein
MRVRRLWSAVRLLAVFAVVAMAPYQVWMKGVRATPPMPLPGYLQTVKDPVFGTSFTRVTDPGREMLPGVTCGRRYCTHQYSSAEAWNADQSLLVIVNGCHGPCLLFLNGQTYKPLFARRVSGECQWHPVDPRLMICVDARSISLWSPRTGARRVVYKSSRYDGLQFGPYKGNPARDGSRIVVRARDRTEALVAFAYDLVSRRKFPDIRLADLPGRNDYCSISPSGRYILCDQVMPDETNQAHVFTVAGAPVQQWLENHRPGHGDMTVDTDGSDVYVGISKSAPDKYHVIKRRLRDGVVTDLAPYGQVQHASIRDLRPSGWVFLTYSGTEHDAAARPDGVPFYQEIVALRIDGSGNARRLVQTRDAKADYWAEAHGSPSPDGSQMIWSSNWGRANGAVSDYVARLHWPGRRAPHG